MSQPEKIYRDADVDASILNGKTIAVIGYGIQGKVQAANTRDSGFKVIIGSRGAPESNSRDQANAVYCTNAQSHLGSLSRFSASFKARRQPFSAQAMRHISSEWLLL